ncbi:hypothetical protein [Halalkalicoccus tibetensis]|uniref:Uncharacterized protein n=1 Tax=Halalkalicoccus tibetensis TaxID=175632 RepID=A0ABD5V5T3_9EURY
MAPTAPSSLPDYLADGLPKQDNETLREVEEYVDKLLAAREQRRGEPVTEDELPEEARVLENESSGAVYLKYHTCDNESCSCMSSGEKPGLYKYRAYRDEDPVWREYLGKASGSDTV